MKKYLIPGMVAIILLALVAAFFILHRSAAPAAEVSKTPVSPVTQNADGTQTLTAKNYGFSFVFPGGWQYNPHTDSNQFLIQTASKNNIVVSVIADQSATVDAYLQKQDRADLTAYEGQPSKKIVSTQNLKLNGVNYTERQETVVAAGLTVTIAYFKNGQNIISLMLEPIPGNPVTADNTAFTQIISSVKFSNL